MANIAIDSTLDPKNAHYINGVGVADVAPTDRQVMAFDRGAGMWLPMTSSASGATSAATYRPTAASYDQSLIVVAGLANAYDGDVTTCTTLNVSYTGSAWQHAQAVWSGFAAFAATPSAATLKVAYQAGGGSIGGGATPSATIEYSLDGGASWSTLASANTQIGMTTTAQAAIAAAQDLTKLQVRCTSAASGTNTVGGVMVLNIYEIWVDAVIGNGLALSTNGVLNSDQSSLDLEAGAGIVLACSNGKTTIASTQNATQIQGVMVDLTGLADGQLLKYDASKGKIVPATVSGGLVKIAEVTLTDNTATITFSAIPQTCRNLILRCSARVTSAYGRCDITMTFNGDKGSNYGRQLVTDYNGGTGQYTFKDATRSSVPCGWYPDTGSDSAYWGIGKSTIYDYAFSDRYKLVDIRCLTDISVSDTSDYVGQGSWRVKAAVTSIVLTPDSGSIAAGSTAMLFGEL